MDFDETGDRAHNFAHFKRWRKSLCHLCGIKSGCEQQFIITIRSLVALYFLICCEWSNSDMTEKWGELLKIYFRIDSCKREKKIPWYATCFVSILLILMIKREWKRLLNIYWKMIFVFYQISSYTIGLTFVEITWTLTS